MCGIEQDVLMRNSKQYYFTFFIHPIIDEEDPWCVIGALDLFPLGGETAVQAVIGSIAWAFRRLKKPRSLEMSARGYALHSLCLQLSFP